MNKSTTQYTKDMTAIILAGGKSSRMGRDKSTIMFDDQPLLLRSINKLKDLFGEVIVLSNQEISFALPEGVKIVQDDVPYQGPLGGISTGLKLSSHDWSLVVAVDMPFVNSQIIEFLAGFAGEGDAVVPMTANGLEPLFAFYSKRCLPVAEEVLMKGERRILSLLSQVDLKVVNYLQFSHLEGADRAFININTQRDLELAKKLEKSGKLEVAGSLTGGFGDVRVPPIERSATIYINGDELVTVQTSMEHLDELACGFLVSEGILQVRDELEHVRVNEETGEVRVRTTRSKTIPVRAMGKRLVTSGCGKGFSFVSPGDALGIGRLNSSFAIPAAENPGLMKEFLRASRRPGMHSSALVKDDEIRLLRQDVGRHNTVDMIIGRLWLDGIEDRDCILMTTGRISYEMVVKAAKARIPVLVSRTAATDMAIKLANKLGVELVGYVRGNDMQVYTDGSRLVES